MSTEHENSEVDTTVVGDFILRWGIVGIATILGLVAAKDFRDLKKIRLSQIENYSIVLSQKEKEIKSNCDMDLLTMKSFISEKQEKLYNENMKLISDNNYKINEVMNKYILTLPDNIFYKIKSCSSSLKSIENIKVKK